jgi:hypothetical protein
VAILGVAGQDAPDLDWLVVTREDGDTIPAFLPMPESLISCVQQGLFGEFFLGRLEFLQAGDIGRGLLQPAEQDRQVAIDAIHIIGCDFHTLVFLISNITETDILKPIDPNG